MDDVRACVDRWQSTTARRLLFRGQTSSYSLNRRRPNPAFEVPGYGEVSLVPSLWRRMIERRPSARQHFRDLHAMEWLRVLESTFDAKDVKRRVETARAAGDWIHSSQDLEDSDDELLKKLGRLQLVVIMGQDHNLATPLHTLLQHYGLVSPVLDLTSDLEVGLFFATHRFAPGSKGACCSYAHIGTNGRRSVLYALREDKTEMEVHGRDRVLDDLNPLRPKRQNCVVCRSAPDALNLAADFLYGVIALDFEEGPAVKYGAADLFPGPDSDRFLRALKANVRHPEHVTTFGP